jgi:NTP pyrophosphatase (non-canonical NTP hydrolase)
MDLEQFQTIIKDTYGERDAERGLLRAHAWFTEECGELSRALFRQGHEERVHEFADVLAWLVTLAELSGVDMAEAARRYEHGCPRCGARPCTC